MFKKKIRLNSVEDTNDFVEICEKYNGDINVHYGSMMIDGKSMLGMLMIPAGELIEVKLISSNECEILKFIKDIARFEAEE